MKMLAKAPIRGTTVKLIGRLLQPIADTGVITIPEFNEIMANLRNLSQKGEVLPGVLPKLLDQKEAAEMLGISFPHFRNMEREGVFPFKRKKIGTAVRYFNTDILSYILSLEDCEEPSKEAVQQAV